MIKLFCKDWKKGGIDGVKIEIESDESELLSFG
jgi:hypothetical protein